MRGDETPGNAVGAYRRGGMHTNGMVRVLWTRDVNSGGCVHCHSSLLCSPSTVGGQGPPIWRSPRMGSGVDVGPVRFGCDADEMCCRVGLAVRLSTLPFFLNSWVGNMQCSGSSAYGGCDDANKMEWEMDGMLTLDGRQGTDRKRRRGCFLDSHGM